MTTTVGVSYSVSTGHGRAYYVALAFITSNYKSVYNKFSYTLYLNL